MELLKISDRNYIPINSIIRIRNEGEYMCVYYQRGSEIDYYSTAIIRDGHTMEEEIQSRLINIVSTKGLINAI